MAPQIPHKLYQYITQALADLQNEDLAGVNRLEAQSESISGGEAVGVDSSAGLGYTFGDGWVQPDADRPTALLLDTTAVTDGTTSGSVNLDVDEDGGTTPDYTVSLAEADASLGAGGTVTTSDYYIIPSGAQVQINNAADPNASNSINTQRLFTL